MFLLHVHEISWDFLKNSSHITSNLKILCFIIRIKCIFKCFFSIFIFQQTFLIILNLLKENANITYCILSTCINFYECLIIIRIIFFHSIKLNIQDLYKRKKRKLNLNVQLNADFTVLHVR